MIVRNAIASDAIAACTVLRRSITECRGEDHDNDPHLLSAWLHNKTPESVAASFAARKNFSIVADPREQIAGAALLTEKGQLALCYALPEVRFTGVGKLYCAH